MRAGTRGSALALWQTEHVVAKLGLPVAIEKIVTRGDVDQTSKLQGGKLEKGLFTEELEAALREQRIDFAVHSLKDLPTKNPEGLCIGAVLERAPANDRLLVREPLPLKDGARVGASSLRREALLRTWFPTAKATLLRGNVPTRVRKLQEGEHYDAIILAAAGLARLNLETKGLTVYELNPRRWVPAPGQGAIAVQCRSADGATRAALEALNHAATARAVHLERELLRIFEGGCTAPFGALVEGDTLRAGAEIDGQWRVIKRPLPPQPDDTYYREVLAALAKAGSGDDETWLHRLVG